jgi:predicted RNA binding protein with dsRBD fold (UPF0201 family)
MTTGMLRKVMEPQISISSLVQPYENAEKIVKSINMFFPDWKVNEIPEQFSFPTKNKIEIISGNSETLDYFFKQIRAQKILDTALDVMCMNLEADSTVFDISRQAAVAGKISFVLDKKILGGTISISLSGDELGLWLEQQTWHEGRNEIPRFPRDEYSMRYDGEPTEWFDKRGRPTINQEED